MKISCMCTFKEWCSLRANYVKLQEFGYPWKEQSVPCSLSIFEHTQRLELRMYITLEILWELAVPCYWQERIGRSSLCSATGRRRLTKILVCPPTGRWEIIKLVFERRTWRRPEPGRHTLCLAISSQAVIKLVFGRNSLLELKVHKSTSVAFAIGRL